MNQQGNQQDKAKAFRALHVPGDPLILLNVWDVGSAVAVAKAGAKALATGSWSIAAANGFADGEKMDLDIHLAVIGRIASASELPVSADLESGYGETPEAVGRTIARALAAGVVGCNLEDSFPADGSLREIAAQVRRYAAARASAQEAGIDLFINVRTDVFFQRPAQDHDAGMVEAALERARAYADAGADGLFVPGLVDISLIARVASGSPLPVNIMRMGTEPSISSLAEAGVARVSHGPGPYLQAMAALEQMARDIR
jgi:2-methylisocitrate lyase-like PEP mutase family enzyme